MLRRYVAISDVTLLRVTAEPSLLTTILKKESTKLCYNVEKPEKKGRKAKSTFL